MKTYTNPQFPGKTFRRLEVGEVIQPSDFCHSKHVEINSVWLNCEDLSGFAVENYEGDAPDPLYYYRELQGYRPLEEGESFEAIAPEPTPDPSAMMLQRIEELHQKLDAVLAKLNGRTGCH